MRYSLYFILLLIIPYIAFSQSISGIVTEKESGDPIEGASVSLLRGSDTSFVKGMTTSSTGQFRFTGISAGSYVVRASLIGYSTSVVRGIRVGRDNNNVILDTILLTSGVTSTEEIVVESERSMVEFAPDKKIFNVEDNAVYKGGTAIDVLRNLPSVTIDADNNVSLRGSENVKIFVDGRPFGLEGSSRGQILEQLSADQIASVELVTNPSAKYEAEGTSGIINIVLKKKRGTGYNGNIVLNAGTGDKYRGSTNFNWRKDNVNLFGNYDFSLRNFDFNGSSNRLFNSTQTNILSEDISDGRMKGHHVRAGIDYAFDPLTLLSLSSRYSNRERRHGATDITKIYDLNNNDLTEHYDRISDENDKEFGIDISSSFVRRFKNEGQSLTADVDVSYEKENEDENSSLNYILPERTPIMNRQFTDEISRDLRSQVDYVHPFTKDRRMDAGIKYIYRDRDIDYAYEDFDTIGNSYYLNTDVSNRFKYKENIGAVYSTYTDKFGPLGIQLGLRGEYTYSIGDLLTTNETFKQNYFDVFPSASLSYQIAEGNEIQLNYSRRINRPRHRMLNSFTDISDPLNIRKGNPNIKPEYIDAYELGYIYFLGKLSITPSLFYRVTHDRMSMYREYLDSITSVMSFTNYDQSRAYGAELLINGQILRWWSVNGNFSWFANEIDASNLGLGSVSRRDTWSARFMTSMRIPDIVNLQANYMYTGKMYTAQGYIEPIQTFDIALNRDIIPDRLNLGLRVSDLFNTMKYNHVINDGTTNDFITRKRESRNVFLTMTYKFGQESKETRRRPRNGNENEEPMEDMEDF